MIAVVVYRDAGGRVWGFRYSGHADFGEHGEDIVCAAVSAIAQTTVLGLMRHLDVPVDVKQKPGLLECRLAGGSRAAQEAAENPAVQALFETMVLGVREVEKQYPEHVRLRSKTIRQTR